MAIKLNLGCGSKRLDGWENLDKIYGWTWESLLPQYKDNSVEAITVSHSLMYVDDVILPSIFQEFYRVLKPNGVVRITEDATDDPNSVRFGGLPETISMTSKSKTENLFIHAGLTPVFARENITSFYEDTDIVQNLHGGQPKCFFAEAVKASSIFIAPHYDDETLFGSYILQRRKPIVFVAQLFA